MFLIRQDNIGNVLRCFSTGKNNHFGFKDVRTEEKQVLVNEVFHSVASKYDVMNDLMSAGVHRYWKNQFVNSIGNLSPQSLYRHDGRPNFAQILDVAGGTGDISFKILENHRFENIKTTVLDINKSMLEEGKLRAEKMNLTKKDIEFVCANAEQLPFENNTFDVYTISFGLRNVPRTRKALVEALRVLKHGGRFMCLEFSKVNNALLRQIYKQYSFKIIPEIGQMITGDRHSYQYLVESIQKFLTQEQLREMMNEVGFTECGYENLTNGVVAIHSGFKL